MCSDRLKTGGLSAETAGWLRAMTGASPNEPNSDSAPWTWSFPSDRVATEYIANASTRPDEEVRIVLRGFLFSPSRFGQDKRLLEEIIQAGGPDSPLGEKWGREFATELFIGHPHVGVRWVMDMLPDQPATAADVIRTYLHTYWQLMPDGRIDGMYDAAELIRARYLDTDPASALATLKGLTSRQFEVVVWHLYQAMGYQCVLTPARRDGGRDIIATSNAEGRRHSLLIECKKHEQTLKVNLARELLGLVSHENRSGGVLVTTADVSRGIRDLARADHRLDFANGHRLVRLLDEYIGPRWVTRIDRLTQEPSEDR